MPKPTTHTDVFVPRPSTEDPVSRVHITLTSLMDGGLIEGQVVEVHQNNASTVKGETSIKHTAQDLLKVTADIEASTGQPQGLEMNGSPTGGPVSVHGAKPTEYRWTGKPAIDDLKIRISSVLGAEDLTPRLSVGSQGPAGADYNEIWLLTARGLTAAKMIVEFK